MGVIKTAKLWWLSALRSRLLVRTFGRVCECVCVCVHCDKHKLAPLIMCMIVWT